MDTAPMPNWQTPPQNLTLENSHIHLWLAELVKPPESVAMLRQLLSQDERERADRFHFEKDRIAYTIGRGTLRQLLAQYLSASAEADISPAEIVFSYNKYGRPTLGSVPTSAAHMLQTCNFNISHSGKLALYGFALNRAIGVDIEWHRDTIEPLEIAKGFFSPTENQTLNGLSTTEEHFQAFYNCWTRKEAYIKAHGMGLSMPLDSFDVTLEPGTPAHLAATRPNPEEVYQWVIDDIPVPTGYTAAIALERSTPNESLATTPDQAPYPTDQKPLVQVSTFRL